MEALSDSNDSSVCCVSNAAGDLLSEDSFPAPTAAALGRLSENLDSLFLSPDFAFCSDARIVVPAAAAEIPVHRCVLAARSSFFRSLFESRTGSASAASIEVSELAAGFRLGYHALVSVLSYLYSGRVKPLPEGVCVCMDDTCSHLACPPAVDFIAEVLYAAFTFRISELLTLYQRHFLDILDKVAIDDVLMILSIASMCNPACEKLETMCIEIVANALVKSDVDIITVEKSLNQDILNKIVELCSNLSSNGLQGIAFPDKHSRSILRALDSDDVELVGMLLKEGNTTLDNAFALHYAVAYCDPKITTELLDFDHVDVNRKTSRGLSVLHFAAMRKEPKIIVSLLTKGARPSDLTLDGMSAIQFCKRRTKPIDYYKPTKEGTPTPNDRLCIDILEEAERSEPLLGEASETLGTAGDDLRERLMYLEERVRLANFLFPMEARVAMDIAKVHCTSPLTMMDLNDGPFKIKDEIIDRRKALSRTVYLGKRFFPRCSDVLNKIMDDDALTQLAQLDVGSLQERELKKRRFNEIQDMFKTAFIADKEDNDRSKASIISPSSSTSLGARSRISKK